MPHHNALHHNHTSSTPSSHHTPCRYTCKAAHCLSLQTHHQKDSNRFLNSTAGTEDNAVVSLMVLQVIVVLLVRKRNIPLFRKKKPANTVFIDHIAAIHSRNRIARTICLLIHHAPLDAVGSIAMLYETAGSKSDARWQI